MFVIVNSSKMEWIVVFLSAMLVVVVKSDPWRCKETNIATATWQDITVGKTAEKIPPIYSCVYKFLAPGYQLVELRIKDLNILSDESCANGYIVVKNETSEDPSDKKYCGNLPPRNIPDNREIYVHTMMEEPKPSDGFTIEFRAVDPLEIFQCPVMTKLESTKTKKHLTIPGAGYMLPAKFDCTYSIIPTNGKSTKISFDKFKVANNTTCVTEYVIVRTSVDPQTADKKHCGTVNPAMMEFSSNVYVQIKGDHFSKYDAFDLIYVSGTRTLKPIALFVALLSMHIFSYQM